MKKKEDKRTMEDGFFITVLGGFHCDTLLRAEHGLKDRLYCACAKNLLKFSNSLRVISFFLFPASHGSFARCFIYLCTV